MSESKPPGGEPPEELIGELDEWDKMFDSLHTENKLAAAAAAAASGAAEPVAPAPAAATPAGPSAVPAPGEDGDAPFAPRRDDDFGDLGLEDAFEPLAPPIGGATIRPSPRAATASGEPDDGLYTSASRKALATSAPVAARPAAAGPRRTAAVVRRDRAVNKPPVAAPVAARPPAPLDDDSFDGDDFAGGDKTSIVSADMASRLAESAQALFRDGPPEVVLELDGDFYDGIEVDDQRPRRRDSTAPAPFFNPPSLARPPVVKPTPAPASKRPGAHVVRRSPRPSPPPPGLTGTPPPPPSGPSASVVVDAELAFDAAFDEPPAGAPPRDHLDPPTITRAEDDFSDVAFDERDPTGSGTDADALAGRTEGSAVSGARPSPAAPDARPRPGPAGEAPAAPPGFDEPEWPASSKPFVEPVWPTASAPARAAADLGGRSASGVSPLPAAKGISEPPPSADHGDDVFSLGPSGAPQSRSRQPAPSHDVELGPAGGTAESEGRRGGDSGGVESLARPTTRPPPRGRASTPGPTTIPPPPPRGRASTPGPTPTIPPPPPRGRASTPGPTTIPPPPPRGRASSPDPMPPPPPSPPRGRASTPGPTTLPPSPPRGRASSPDPAPTSPPRPVGGADRGAPRGVTPPFSLGRERAATPIGERDSGAALDVDLPTDVAEPQPDPGDDLAVDVALDHAVAIADGTLRPTDLDAPPELPPSKFPEVEPTLDVLILTIDLPAEAPPATDDRTEAMARELVVVERELLGKHPPELAAAMRLEAGRLAERLGDLDRARAHHDAALQLDPALVPPLRALRRIERALGNPREVIRHLDAEIALVGDGERRALAAYRADLLMAAGEDDLARVAVGELVDAEPGDVRALLAELELNFVDGRLDDVEVDLERLARAIADLRLSTALSVVRAGLAERGGRDGRAVAVAAAEASPTDGGALLATWIHATSAGDATAARAALARLLEVGELERADPELATAIELRLADAAVRTGDREGAAALLGRAADRAPADLLVARAQAELAVASAGETADPDAGVHLARLAALLPTRNEKAATLRRLAALDPAGARDALRRAVDSDPADAIAAADYRRALEQDGALDEMIQLDRRVVAGDPDGAAFERARVARRLAAAGRTAEALAELAAARVAGIESPALAVDLADALRAAGPASERAALLQRLAAEGRTLPARQGHRRAALALEEAARIEPLAPERVFDAVPEPRFDAASEPVGSGPTSIAAGGVAPPPDRLGAAMAEWRQVLDAEPGSTEARLAIRRLAAARGDAAALDAALAEAQEHAVPPARAVAIALHRAAQLVERDPAAAEAILAAVAEAGDGDPRATAARIQLLAAEGRFADAAAVLEARADALGEGDEATCVRFRAGGLWLEQADEPARARDAFLAVVHARPRFAAAGQLLQAAQRRLGDTSPAAPAAATTAAPIRPTSPDAFAELIQQAEALERGGEPGRAIGVFRRALALRDGDPVATAGLFRASVAAADPTALVEVVSADLATAEAGGYPAAIAAAHEELARIELELRGDPAAALGHWEAAVAQDPARVLTLRRLERAYLDARRDRELHGVWSRLAAIVEAPADRLAAALEQSRLAEAAELGAAEVLDHDRAAWRAAPGSRLALFRLEAAARERGPSRELAELELAVADLLAADPRARAAFLTRSGETLRAVGEIDEAIARFRTAVGLVPGHGIALAGWRTAALSTERWQEVAESAEREAEAAATSEGKVRLWHLAGVTFMDRVGLSDRAVSALRRVLLADPAHRDAFARLRRLFDAEGRAEDLASLYRRRLDAEAEPAIQIALHHALADLDRRFFEDRRSAREHLNAVLALAPSDRAAVAGLSDIAWELGEWAEAAEALIVLARLESNPATLRGIFYRLGTLYADFLSDGRWAMMCFQKVLAQDPTDRGALERIADLATTSGDFRLALGACEQLIKLDPPIDQKVAHLHRVARIYQTGLADPSRAERALRMALDLDLTSEIALGALAAFYRDGGDLVSLRVHLDRVIGAMRIRVDADLLDRQAYEVLARALEARAQARVPGTQAVARAAAELAVSLGSPDPTSRALVEAPPRGTIDLAALGRSDHDDLIFPPAASNSLRQLFQVLGDRLAKHVGLDLRRFGVGRAERLRKGADPLAETIEELAAELGAPDIEIYVSTKQPTVAVAEPTSPLSLVLGRELAEKGRPAELRFVVGRAIKLALTSLAVPARMQPDELGVLLGGLLRQFSPEVRFAGLDDAQVGAEQQRLRRLIPSNLVAELSPYAHEIIGGSHDHRAIWRAIVEGGNRAGLLAAGATQPSLAALCRMSGYSSFQQGAADPLVAALVRFAVSEEHVALRASLEG